RSLAEEGRSVRGAELRGAARAAARIRAVWPRAGRVYERAPVESGPSRARGRRHLVSRRSERDERLVAGEVPPCPSGTRVPAAGRNPCEKSRRPNRGCHQPRPANGGWVWGFSPGTLL